MKRAHFSGKLAFAITLSALSFGATTAQATLTVVPNQFASAEGNSSSSSLFQTNAATLQVFYSEDFLATAGITAGSVINGIAYRRNGGGTTGPAGDTTFASYNIFMSQSFATPGEMTTTFANNIVGAQTQVHSGSKAFAAGSFTGGATPNAFGPVVDFTTGYAYNGGSLLIEIRRSARTGDLASNNTDTDNTVASQAGSRWVFNTSSDAALTGTAVNGGHVFQLQYEAVPEPTTMTVLALGGLALLRKKRQAK